MWLPSGDQSPLNEYEPLGSCVSAVRSVPSGRVGYSFELRPQLARSSYSCTRIFEPSGEKCGSPHLRPPLSSRCSPVPSVLIIQISTRTPLSYKRVNTMLFPSGEKSGLLSNPCNGPGVNCVAG